MLAASQYAPSSGRAIDAPVTRTRPGSRSFGATVGEDLFLALSCFGGAGGLLGPEADPFVLKSARVSSAKIDQDLGEAAVEEQVGRQVRALKALLLHHFENGAASQSEPVAPPPKLRRTRVFHCQRPEVPRGANSQWANIPDRLVSVWGKRPVDDSRELPSIRLGAGLKEVIDALQLAVVLVGAIEQQRIERLAEEKGSGGCNPCLVEDPCALSHIGSRRWALVRPERNDDHPLGAQTQRRTEGDVESKSSIHVELPIQPHRGKEDWDRSGRQSVFRADPRGLRSIVGIVSPGWQLPSFLHERNRPPAPDVGGAHRERFVIALAQISANVQPWNGGGDELSKPVGVGQPALPHIKPTARPAHALADQAPDIGNPEFQDAVELRAQPRESEPTPLGGWLI